MLYKRKGFYLFIWVILFIYYSTGTKRIVALVLLVATILLSTVVIVLVFTKVKPKKWSPTFLGYLAAGSGCAMYLFPLWSAVMQRFHPFVGLHAC